MSLGSVRVAVDPRDSALHMPYLLPARLLSTDHHLMMRLGCDLQPPWTYGANLAPHELVYTFLPSLFVISQDGNATHNQPNEATVLLETGPLILIKMVYTLLMDCQGKTGWPD